MPLANGNRPFPRHLLAGVDAGLAPRAADRPQSIAAWRPALTQSGTANDAVATVVMRSATPVETMAAASAASTSRRRWAITLSAGIAVVCLSAGGWLLLGDRPLAPPSSVQASAVTAPIAPAQPRPQEELEQARREQKAAQDEAARLRAEAEARRRSDEEAALRRKIEEEVRQKAEAEEAARQRATEDARHEAQAKAAAQRQAEEEATHKAETEAAARLKAEEEDRKGAEATETALRLTQPDRQRIQIALIALGFGTGGTDGVFGPRSREMIAAWQKKSGRAATGYLSADGQAALLREAGPALARYE